MTVASPITPFDFIKAIHSKKVGNLNNPNIVNKYYVPFIANKSLSFDISTILYAQELNKHPTIDKDLQFTYYLNTIRKGMTRKPWIKQNKNQLLTCICKEYNVSLEKAIDMERILTPEQKEQLLKQEN